MHVASSNKQQQLATVTYVTSYVTSTEMMPEYSTLIASSSDIEGITTPCRFSPDGSCVLTSTSDNLLRLYNTPLAAYSPPLNDHKNQTEAWNSVLNISTGDSIRSYSWFPKMNSFDPSSCAFLASVKEQPVHLYDAYNGTIRATYRPYNALDEMESPNIVTFTPDGSRIFTSGFQTDRTVHIFDTNIPGRDSSILRLGKTRRSKDGQKGIISALSFPDGNSNFFGHNIFAVGTFSPGSIYIYDDRQSAGDPAGVVMHGGVCIVGHGTNFTKKKRRFVDITSEDDASAANNDISSTSIFSAAKANWYQNRARGGVTQIEWSRGGQSDYLLYTSSRRSDAIIAWDVRMITGCASHSIHGALAFMRAGDTNQRMTFDLDLEGRRLFASSQDSSVKVFDATNGKLNDVISDCRDAVNGVSFVGTQTNVELLAVSTGTRHFHEDSDDGVEDTNDQDVGSLGLYYLSRDTS